MTDWYPCFIDVEASGFGPESWPVAVAWCDQAGAISRHLIDPSGVPEWTYWDAAAEQVHGLSREHLAAHGRSPQEVAALLAKDFNGVLAFSDAPEFDTAWLQRLFQAAGGTLPFRIDNADDLLVGAILRPGEALWQAQARLERLKAEMQATAIGRHDAGYDVGFLVAMWRRAMGEVVHMNHGEGPVPELTKTGSFRRRKGESAGG